MPDIGVGPIDYLALSFPGARFTGDGLEALLDLVDRGIVQILDLRVVKREMDGTVTAIALTDLDGDGTLDVAAFDGVESGLLGDDDLGKVASLIEPGDAVGLLVYENTWARRFVSAMAAAGAEVIASARVPAADIVARLDELESNLARSGA
jgi:hypothetical protein